MAPSLSPNNQKRPQMLLDAPWGQDHSRWKLLPDKTLTQSLQGK